MDNLIYLRCNTEPVVMNNLVTGRNTVMEYYEFGEGEIWYDQSGVIRQFSVRYADGTVGNHFLLPLEMTSEKVLHTLAGDLAQFGIHIAANSLFAGSTLVLSLAKFLFEKYGNIAVSDYAKNYQHSEMAYIALDNKQSVFKGPININTTIVLRALMIYLQNNYGYDVIYETSRDLVKWKSSIAYANSIAEFYFTNRQSRGYIRLHTGGIADHPFEIFSGRAYSIYWEEKKQKWILVKSNVPSH